MAETGSVRSSEGASSSYAEEKERSIVTQKIDECKLQLKELNAVRAADVEKFIESTKKVETAHGFGDNPQINRMRHNFERKNRKHTSDSDALQKKLADYEEKLRQINSGEYEPSPTKSSRLRRTGTNIKGMTENVISGPLEIAHKIKSAFGSADDIRSHRSKNFGEL
ncbi:unnamed protein product [Caenorhabditis auriculariae]|uniref:Uncharacterized protein n=1 Tax=Caenorhabditis auriculariae TaxID=2777116 RepID=A0A8S1GP56_9PELO|nr:unnamed protein product [Caenorhabditis auriculariae]